MRERIAADAGDRQCIDRFGNGHRTAGAEVIDDGDSSAISRVEVGCRRVQYHGRTPTETRPPPSGPGQVIDNHIAGTRKDIRTGRRGVALKIGPSQAATIAERKTSDAGQALASRDVGQAGTVSERIALDVGHAVGDGVTSTLAARTLEKRGLALVKQYPIQAAVGGVERFHRDSAQTGA